MSISNDRGFFVVLMVALVSFALWATMSTMHIYSVNKMDAHAKAKEANEMYNTLSDFAAEAQAGYYRSVIENQGEEGNNCPAGYDNCTWDEGGGTKPNLCLKEKSCNACLDSSNGKNVVEYCGNFFGFGGKDDLGDCSDPEVLCVAASIDVADRKNPPSSTDLKDCDTCFVQPFKIFVDTVIPNDSKDQDDKGDCVCQEPHPYASSENLCGATSVTVDGCTCYKGTVCDTQCGWSCDTKSGTCKGGITCSGQGECITLSGLGRPGPVCGKIVGQGCNRPNGCSMEGEYSSCHPSTGYCYYIPETN